MDETENGLFVHPGVPSQETEDVLGCHYSQRCNMNISVTIMTIVIIMIIIIFTDCIIIKKTHLSRSNASGVWILEGEGKQVLWKKTREIETIQVLPQKGNSQYYHLNHIFTNLKTLFRENGESSHQAIFVKSAFDKDFRFSGADDKFQGFGPT